VHHDLLGVLDARLARSAERHATAVYALIEPAAV
jgi:hypothetical protein